MEISNQVLFKCGQLNYHTFRIPSLISLPNNILIAFSEGRKNSQEDHGDIQIFMRKSIDGGLNWEPPVILLHYQKELKFKNSISKDFETVSNYGEVTCGNPCPLYDKKTRKLWLSYTLDNSSLWLVFSDDFGDSWSKPRNITEEAFGTNHKTWTHLAAGPGHGIQLKNGRLIIPCDHHLFERSRGYFSMLVVSDDHGKTWEMGAVSDARMDECEVCELESGDIYWNMRSYRKKNYRVVAYSKNHGDDFEEFTNDFELIEPICQASVLRYEYNEYENQDIVLFSNPASKTRDHMTIKVSYDGAKTWEKSILLYEGPSAYSDLAYNQKGEVCILYECGKNNPYEAIVFSRLKIFD
ncbi:MAG: exo-alpha-sialidase [Candidatus Lokiarchaeota archaeon]|nr:exo-alpha-sialidase [Candidatus Lokiarchaeota archaeon]